MITVQSLWVGRPLSAMQQLCINSYLYHGHEFHLYTYDDISGIPAGTIVKDAREVMPAMGPEFPNCATFADFFRYKLLFAKGNWWVDMDSVCLRPFDFTNEYVFSSEIDVHDRLKLHVNNGSLKAPVGSPILKFLIDQCALIDLRRVEFADSGPKLTARAVREFGMQEWVQSPNTFCPIPFWDTKKFFGVPEQDFSSSYAIHLWNEMWTREKHNPDAAYPSNCLYEQLKRRYSRTQTFNSIYLQRKWEGDESASGHGSDLNQTVTIRRELPSLIRGLDVRLLLDAPCGDFNWMKTTELPLDGYIGLDIVPKLIDSNTKLYGNSRRKFVVGDVVQGGLPRADMVLCRDCLNHLPIDDGLRAIQNFKNSGAKYLAATTFLNCGENSDKATWSFTGNMTSFTVGDWRPLNLSLPPFDLGQPLRAIIEDVEGSHSDKALGIWRLA